MSIGRGGDGTPRDLDRFGHVTASREKDSPCLQSSAQAVKPARQLPMAGGCRFNGGTPDSYRVVDVGPFGYFFKTQLENAAEIRPDHQGIVGVSRGQRLAAERDGLVQITEPRGGLEAEPQGIAEIAQESRPGGKSPVLVRNCLASDSDRLTQVSLIPA